jgi:hypothetical protein
LGERIGQLEKLIASFVDHAHQSTPGQVAVPGNNTDKDPHNLRSKPLQGGSGQTESFGRMRLRDSKTTYVEGTNWTAVLDGVRSLLIPPS